MDQMTSLDILEHESRLLERVTSRIEQDRQLSRNALASSCIEYRTTWAAGPASALGGAANGATQNPFSGVGILVSEDVQVILQAVVSRSQRCRVGTDSAFAVLTHNSQGRRLTTGGHANLFQVSNCFVYLFRE